MRPSWVSERIENTEILRFLPVPYGVAYQTKLYELTIKNKGLKTIFDHIATSLDPKRLIFATLGFIRSLMDQKTKIFYKHFFTWWVEAHFEKKHFYETFLSLSKDRKHPNFAFFPRPYGVIYQTRAHESTFTNESLISFVIVQVVFWPI